MQFSVRSQRRSVLRSTSKTSRRFRELRSLKLGGPPGGRLGSSIGNPFGRPSGSPWVSQRDSHSGSLSVSLPVSQRDSHSGSHSGSPQRFKVKNMAQVWFVRRALGLRIGDCWKRWTP